MQVLYAMNRDKDLTPRKALNIFHKNISQSFELYLFNLLLFQRITEYSKIVKKKNESKLRPTEEDKAFRPKLCDNPLIHALQENMGLRNEYRKYKIPDRIREDNIRTLYKDFSQTEDYLQYLKKENTGQDDHRQVLLSLYKKCVGNEVFEDVMDENFLFWQDDKSLVVGAMKKTLKALPLAGDFYEAYRPMDETVKDFGEVLLNKVNTDSKELLSIIEPTLKNWDADRVAVIDMILLKMAVCELINFPTIPTKVTLNEFVEISKLYSTDKSKDFINGILDRLLKKLDREGKIVKEGRGLIEE